MLHQQIRKCTTKEKLKRSLPIENGIIPVIKYKPQILKSGFLEINRLIEQREKGLFVVLFSVILILRISCIFYTPIDGDEPQHLHVIWSWTQGLVQYRDVFDNHTPLFHLLMVPIMAFLGSHPDIIVVMRFFLLPIFLSMLLVVYLLSQSVFGRRAALWTTLWISTALCLGLRSYFLRKTIEFRPAILKKGEGVRSQHLTYVWLIWPVWFILSCSLERWSTNKTSWRRKRGEQDTSVYPQKVFSLLKIGAASL